MRHFLYFLTFLLIQTSPAFADNKTAPHVVSNIPIYAQKVQFTLPQGWQIGHEDSSDAAYIMEIIPKGQSVDSWTDMFTVQGLRGLAKRYSPEEMTSLIAKTHVPVCKETLVYRLLSAKDISGHPAQTSIIGCGKVNQNHQTGVKKGMGEIAYYTVIKGQEDYYIFHKSHRSTPFDPNTPSLNKSNIYSFIKDFLPFKICKKAGAITSCTP